MDLDITVETEDLIRKAPDWNFSNDCELLELMKRVSKNLQDRANHTLEAMNKFDFNVKATEITLDNVNNSLRALHYGEQFVEYRVREEDETVATTDEKLEVESEEPPKSKEEILKEFLQNNIKMLRRYYEKRTIEVPDSDDEEGAATTTCIYQLKNPYNKPLPYLIGSKEWNDHWHVGLVDSSNEYSDEEKSEEFSESSSSVDANEPIHEESLETSNLANLSDWDSSLSLNNENLKGSQKADSNSDSNIINTNAVLLLPKQPLLANDSISSSSQNTTPTRPISFPKRPLEHDLFAAIRDSPPSDDIPVISSSTSSSEALHKTVIPQHKQQLPSTNKSPNSRQNFVEEPSSTHQSNTSTQPTTSKVSQIKRKPVNLFDDNDFNSFMSEIANKVQERVDSEAATVVTNINKTHLPQNPITKPQVENTAQKFEPDIFAKPRRSTEEFKDKTETSYQSRKTVNLFDDSPPQSPNKFTENQTSEDTKNRINAKSLFEDDEFLENIGTIEKQRNTSLNATSTKVKDSDQMKFLGKLPLFMDDDDDDDLDINNIFASKSAQTTTSKTKNISAHTSLFDDDNDSDTDLFGNKKTTAAKSPIVQKTECKKPDEIKDSSTTVIKEELKPKTQALQTKNEKSPESNNNETIMQMEEAKKNDNTAECLQAEGKPSQAGYERNQCLSKEIKTVKLFEAADVEDDELFKNLNSHKKPVSFTDNDLPSDTKMENREGTLHEQKHVGEPKHKNFDSDKDQLSPTITNVNETKKDQSNIKPKNKTLADNIENKEAIVFNKNTYDKAPEQTVVESIQTLTAESNYKEVGSDQVVRIEDCKDDEATEELQTESKISTLSEKSQKIISDDKIDDNIIEDEDTQREEPKIDSRTIDITKEPKTILAAHTPSYNSIFMDEPPDDSEFFQTLGSSKLGNSKLFDLENDFDEPALPVIPGNTMTSPDAGQANATGNYGGLRLFSEVPPDDYNDHNDDFDNSVLDNSSEIKTIENVISRIEQTASGTTRLHTIFYNDFSETATSTATAKTEQISSAHLAFSNEPPPDLAENEADVVDRSAKNDEQAFEGSESPKRETVTVNKLKKPTININVQALLPSTGAIPKIKKLITPAVQPTVAEKQKVAAETNIGDKSKTSNNVSDIKQNTLSHMNKTRVRAPIKRRPSTRHARQENYRKSLLDETHPEHKDHNNDLVDMHMPVPNVDMIVKSSDKSTKNAFLGSDDDDYVPISSPTKLSVSNAFKKPTDFIATDTPVVAPKTATAVSNAPSKELTSQTMKSFLDTDDDDEDIFASTDNKIQKPTVVVPEIKSKEIIIQKPTAPNAKHKESSIFSSDDDDEDNADFLRSLKRTPSKPKVISNTLFSDVDSDDGDDLFGGGHGVAKRQKKVSQHSKKQINVVKSIETNVANTSTSVATTNTVKDNPLADLLGP